MNKFLTLPPLSFLLPNTDKPSISIPLHAILALHFHRYIHDFSKPNTDLLIMILGLSSFGLIIIAALYSLSILSKLNKAKTTNNQELEVQYKLKMSKAIQYQLILTLIVFFGLVFKVLAN